MVIDHWHMANGTDLTAKSLQRNPARTEPSQGCSIVHSRGEFILYRASPETRFKIEFDAHMMSKATCNAAAAPRVLMHVVDITAMVSKTVTVQQT
jgi:hypothetical protein